MSYREEVSLETLQRAIRARIVLEFGLNSPCTVAKLPIETMDASASGLNWQLLPVDDHAESCQFALMAAAASVAGTFNLKVRH